MSISFRKIQWIVAGAALVLVGALAAGTWFRADSAQLGDQQKLGRTEKLPKVPGKSITAIVVSYPPGGKSGPHHHAGSVVAYVLSGARNVATQYRDMIFPASLRLCARIPPVSTSARKSTA
jgi:hypothetical protein